MSKLGIGLMSGTSLDGIDAVLCRVNGTGFETELEVLDAYSISYTDAEKQKIMALCDEETARVDEITAMNFYLAEKFSEAVLQLVDQSDYSLKDIDFISSHGQTIYHLPDEGKMSFNRKAHYKSVIFRLFLSEQACRSLATFGLPIWQQMDKVHRLYLSWITYFSKMKRNHVLCRISVASGM